SSFYGGHLFFAAVSPFTTGGHNFTNQTTHYNLLSTVEWLLGLGGTGNNDSTSSFPPMKALFHSATNTTQSKFAVKGRVTALSTGLAISGASVAVSGGASATTNTTGSYSFLLPNGTYTISASASGFVTQSSSVKVSGSAVTQNFALNSSSTTQTKYPVRGQVTALSTGLGIPGVTVSVSGGSGATTNASGYYSFSLANGTYTISASVSGFVTQSSSVKVSGSAVTQNFALASQSRSGSTYEIAGTVESWYNYSALSGATVGISGGSTLQTGSNGTYWFYEPNGTYTVTAWHAGSRVTSASVTVAGGSVTHNFLLPRYYWEVSGVVTNAATGARIAGANVSVASGPSSYNQYAVTSSTGSYILWLANGTYGLRAVSGSSAANVSVTVNGAALLHNITLSSSGSQTRTYRISGTVESWYNYSLLSGATVRISGGSSLQTAANGTYWFYEPNGSYTVTAWHAGSKVTSASITVAGAPVTYNFLLPRFYWQVSGVVTNATTGAVVSGATVSVISGPSSYNQSSVTTSSGVYVLWLANGTYGLRVTHTGSPTRTISITVSGSSGGSNISLTPVRAGSAARGSIPLLGRPPELVATVPRPH
ncbi:MAG TPA: carboxypeptidase regulatory-like domain-containing protein, partial [Thermoplasmata archaeon]|nr:carboxypeptidase regulatory-like domain-containing protein [Thermoplasmata archaeon]